MEKFLSQDIHCSLIGGKSISSANTPAVDFITPITGKPWKKIIPVGAKETQEAITVAHNAFLQWRKTTGPQRAMLLRQAANLIFAHKELLSEVMAWEMGKTLKEGRGEVDYCAGFFSWFAGEAERIYGKIIPALSGNKNLSIIYEPVGVCGIITPWNFPVGMPARKIAAALAAGCTVVAKPSPETPFSMLLLAKLCHMAGIPADCFNVVIGPEKEIGDILLESPWIKKISFTGSTAVGKYLYEKSAPTLKKLTMELGGHAPLIVLDDADLDHAVAHTVASKFRNTGQTCISANRIFVQESIYNLYIEKLTNAVKMLKVGDPFDESTDVSRILHPISALRVKEQLDDALEKGAEAAYVSEFPYEPKLLSKVTPTMKIFQEETFGPLAALIEFKELEEAVTLANATEYGLAAYVFTDSMKRAAFAVAQLEYGIIGVNDTLPSAPQASFGGIKSSGLGREGGPTGIYEYLTEKFVSIEF